VNGINKPGFALLPVVTLENKTHTLMMVMAVATRTIPVLQAAQSIQTMMMN
jgi:hypothetical protein